MLFPKRAFVLVNTIKNTQKRNFLPLISIQDNLAGLSDSLSEGNKHSSGITGKIGVFISTTHVGTCLNGVF